MERTVVEVGGRRFLVVVKPWGQSVVFARVGRKWSSGAVSADDRRVALAARVSS